MKNKNENCERQTNPRQASQTKLCAYDNKKNIRIQFLVKSLWISKDDVKFRKFTS